MHVVEWIDRWQAKGLLDQDVAAALRQDVGDADRVGADGGLDGDLLGALGGLVPGRSLVLEAVGYLGAALVVGALAILFDIDQWPRALLVVLLLGASAAAAWGMGRLLPVASGAASRLASVAMATSVGSLAGGLSLALEQDCQRWGTDNRCTWTQEHFVPWVVVVVVAAAAWWLYRQHRTALTHIVVGASSFALVFFTSQLPFSPTSDSYRSEEATFGALLLAVAAGWIWASEHGLMRPAWVGTFGASASFFGGLVMLVGFDPFFGGNDDATIVASLFAGMGFLALGVTGDRLRLTIVGVIALLFMVPATLMEVFGLSGATVTLVMLPTGLALLACALRETRKDLAREPETKEAEPVA